MHITVTFRHMESSDALKQYAEEKTRRIEKYLEEPIEVHWVLSVEKIRHIAEATVVAKNITINAREETQDMYSAIDLAIDKLEKQVRRHKEKVKNHKHVESPRGGFTPESTEPERTPRVVKIENMFVKPMTLEEATLQMEVTKRNFLVYTDSTTSTINVLYRREDGNFGLIETRTK